MKIRAESIISAMLFLAIAAAAEDVGVFSAADAIAQMRAEINGRSVPAPNDIMDGHQAAVHQSWGTFEIPAHLPSGFWTKTQQAFKDALDNKSIASYVLDTVKTVHKLQQDSRVVEAIKKELDTILPKVKDDLANAPYGFSNLIEVRVSQNEHPDKYDPQLLSVSNLSIAKDPITALIQSQSPTGVMTVAPDKAARLSSDASFYLSISRLADTYTFTIYAYDALNDLANKAIEKYNNNTCRVDGGLRQVLRDEMLEQAKMQRAYLAEIARQQREAYESGFQQFEGARQHNQHNNNDYAVTIPSKPEAPHSYIPQSPSTIPREQYSQPQNAPHYREIPQYTPPKSEPPRAIPHRSNTPQDAVPHSPSPQVSPPSRDSIPVKPLG